MVDIELMIVFDCELYCIDCWYGVLDLQWMWYVQCIEQFEQCVVCVECCVFEWCVVVVLCIVCCICFVYDEVVEYEFCCFVVVVMQCIVLFVVQVVCIVLLYFVDCIVWCDVGVEQCYLYWCDWQVGCGIGQYLCYGGCV